MGAGSEMTTRLFFCIIISKMRVIHPGDFEALFKKRTHNSRLPILVVLLAALAVGYFLYPRQDGPKQKSADTQQKQLAAEVEERPKTGKLKTFTGPEFKALARSVKYPNTQLFNEPPDITESRVADERIREIAESRGYVMTSIPVFSIEKINEPRLESDDLLQPLAAIAWRDLKATAKRDGIPLSLLSAYRSPEYQRNLFLQRLKARGANTARIAAGQADTAIEATLETTAVPGYSRHHTGYTIDLWCDDGSSAFLNSACFTWIQADNYKKAKQAGWIPSYPEGVTDQGPEPEPWEYIWVGEENLLE